MSLIDQFSFTCTRKVLSYIPDGYGGQTQVWTDGDSFTAAITLDNSVQARQAEQQGVTGMYTVTTTRNVSLQFHDVFARSDGKIFRVTSDGDDKYTPASACLDMRQVSAEEWELTT